ncbi:hypothetical protein QU593_03465 [Rossellomorea marisflavi]|uniref:hypothetical protein n=1 Tax=Rossellomorea marisflavi TaxID=189381 RepID=UPI0025AED971|nr:hypothetical protein [Rossellomorea marisflavi]WJV19551.1 hypothetical protein QU593_03465 [Rossellomorea marisflavi]
METLKAHEARRLLKSFCRRSRATLKQTYLGNYSAEQVSDILVQTLELKEVKRIVQDIRLIDQRGGNSTSYLILILDALKEYLENEDSLVH